MFKYILGERIKERGFNLELDARAVSRTGERSLNPRSSDHLFSNRLQYPLNLKLTPLPAL